MYALGEPVFKLQRFLSLHDKKCVHVYDLDCPSMLKSPHPNAHWQLYQLGYADGKYLHLHNCTVAERIAIDQMSTLELKRKLLAEPDNAKAYVLAAMREDVVAVFDQNPHLVQRYMSSDRWVAAQLSKNVHAMPILESYIRSISLDKFDCMDLYKNILSNPAIVQLPEQYWRGIFQKVLDRNPHTSYYLLSQILVNPHDTVVQYIIDNKSALYPTKAMYLYRAYARSNPNNKMMDWIEELDKPFAHTQQFQSIDWYNSPFYNHRLFTNPNPRAISKIQERIEHHHNMVATITNNTPVEEVTRIIYQFRAWVFNIHVWLKLLVNPSAFELIEKYAHMYVHFAISGDYDDSEFTLKPIKNDCAHWNIYKNPAAFDYDYAAMRNNMRPFAEEIIAKAMHPRRMAQWIEEEEEEENMEKEIV